MSIHGHFQGLQIRYSSKFIFWLVRGHLVVVNTQPIVNDVYWTPVNLWEVNNIGQSDVSLFDHNENPERSMHCGYWLPVCMETQEVTSEYLSLRISFC